MKNCILLTGGAGYIGTNIINKLSKSKYKIVCVDNFSNSYNTAINALAQNNPNIIVECGDLLDDKFMQQLFNKYRFDMVIHLAGKKYVNDSFKEKDAYYLNNVTATKKLLDLMDEHDVKKIIFASSITVYGLSDKIPLTEDLPYNAQSPYAQTKVDGENLIKQWCNTNKCAIILRLSNPVGANVKCMLGDNSKNTNLALLPYLIKNINNLITINGNTYPTKDGTTVRDYIHVEDVANAFVLACNYNALGVSIFNIGSSLPGYSVLEMVKQVEITIKKPLNYVFGKIRDGDVPILVTNTNAAKKELKFKVNKSLKDIVASQFAYNKYLTDIHN